MEIASTNDRAHEPEPALGARLKRFVLWLKLPVASALIVSALVAVFISSYSDESWRANISTQYQWSLSILAFLVVAAYPLAQVWKR